MTMRAAVLVWVALLAMLGASLLALQLETGPLRYTLHLGAAAVMAALVMTVFMRLKTADGMMRLFALGGLFWLSFLFLLTLLELLSRTPQAGG